MADIDIDDLQACVDDCEKGKQTKRNMRTACGLVYKYGIPRNMIPNNLNLADFLRVDGEDGPGKNALPEEAVEKIKAVMDTAFAADYAYCQCFLGFRPSELLHLDAKDYNRKERAFVGGAKTEAGKDRVVTISPKIQPIIDRLTMDKISGPVFCDESGGQMSLEAYRSHFYAALEAAGVENPVTESNGVKRHKYTPHSCRHSCASILINQGFSLKDVQEWLGHADIKMTANVYAHLDVARKQNIADMLARQFA